ncbi:ribonuclease P protein component [Candidatus Parcubacteria bacterium]|nr:ribonuclease P protein component [Patescibacteria group bacterium]MBU4482021.1 ribonuclease P protein component [Patescibacteria group bacterium]MCG2686836.1 ribonuclease P protein component [Candidatus Parcubacteria bacterium]
MIATLSKQKDFEQVAKKGRSFFTKEFGFKIIKNNLSKNRYGIVVNLKVDKRAVARNKIRRRIKEIVRLNDEKLKQGFDVMILTRELVKELSYQEIKSKLLDLFKKAGIFNF